MKPVQHNSLLEKVCAPREIALAGNVTNSYHSVSQTECSHVPNSLRHGIRTPSGWRGLILDVGGPCIGVSPWRAKAASCVSRAASSEKLRSGNSSNGDNGHRAEYAPHPVPLQQRLSAPTTLQERLHGARFNLTLSQALSTGASRPMGVWGHYAPTPRRRCKKPLQSAERTLLHRKTLHRTSRRIAMKHSG